MEKFDADRLFMALGRVVGVALARKLLPRFAQAAAGYQQSDGETIAQTNRRRRVAKAHIALLDATEKDIAQLLRRMDALIALVPEVSTRGYLSGESPSGPFGQLAAAAIRTNLESARESVRMMSEARTWGETLRVCRETARLDLRGKPGQKIGDRRLLAEWIALQLSREDVPLKKSVNSTLAKVLSIMYDAAGIKVPKNLYRDVCHAIDAAARDRQKVH